MITNPLTGKKLFFVPPATQKKISRLNYVIKGMDTDL